MSAPDPRCAAATMPSFGPLQGAAELRQAPRRPDAWRNHREGASVTPVCRLRPDEPSGIMYTSTVSSRS